MGGAAIAGATGLTGQQVLNRVLDGGDFDPVVAVLRKPMHRSHPRLLERVVDFQALNRIPPVALDVAICCLGTTIRKAGSKDAFRAVDYGYVMAFAEWARTNGARRFLVMSSVMADAESGNFYLRVKGELERDLGSVGFEWLDIFQPSFLLGTRHAARPGERIGQSVVQALEFVLTGPLERYRGIAASTVAEAMLTRAKTPGDPGVRRFEWRQIMELANALSR
jgi:uncharacterized protein YbjT (DUF2867 family)